MSTQHTTHQGATAGATVRDIRTAPGYSAHAVGIEAEGATLTVTSAGWNTGSATLSPGPSRGSAGGRRSFVDRMHDRKMVQWMLAYFGFAWLMLQLSGELTEAWEWSALVRQAVSITLALGIIPALVVAWYHGEKGRQQVCTTECALVGVSLVASVAVVWGYCLGIGL